MRLPCPYCGRLVERLVEGMCEECYIERHPLVMLKDDKVLRCKYCGAVFLKGEWVGVKDFSKVLSKKGVVAGVLEKIEVSETAGGARALVYIRGTPHPAIEPRLLSYVVEISYEEDICNSCREMLSRREVAVIQIRGMPRPVDEDTERKIFYITQQELFKLKDKKIGYISNIKRVRNGFDIYTTSTGLAKHLAYVIHREFPSLLIESAKAVGVRDGRKIYHMTYSLRLATYRPGDVVKIRGIEVKILKIGKKFIDVEKLETKTYEQIPLGDFFHGDILLLKS